MAANCTCMEDENSSFVLAGIKGNVMRYRILLTSAALVTAVMTSETLMRIDAQADEEIILSQQTDLLYKPSSFLEARISAMNPLNLLGLCGLQNINGKFYFVNCYEMTFVKKKI